MKIPDFHPSSVWLNSFPLSFEKELQGKITLLYFWDICRLPRVLLEIRRLQKKYAQEPIAILSVHTPSFTHECNPLSSYAALWQYGIDHPVVNDPEALLKHHLGIVRCPFFAIVGPHGDLLHLLSGEKRGSEIDSLLQNSLDVHRQALNATPLIKKKEALKESFFLFPTKLALSKEGSTLFVSDSGHHRIIKIHLESHEWEPIGSNEAGFRDGSWEQASFCFPQGIAFKDQKLYVADTNNHALREIDLTNRTVATLAGNGREGNDIQGGKKRDIQALSFPMDLCFANKKIFISMAGTHQIWVYSLTEEIAQNYSGCGVELHLNHGNPLKAAWSYPSGISHGWERLFIADSGNSAIRSIHLHEGGTETLAGGGAFSSENSSAFGDAPGIGSLALLQRPLGLVWHPLLKQLFIADTYNHRIKILDPRTHKITSWVGSGCIGNRDGEGEEAEFFEPSGLAISPEGKWMYVADTNNHAIRIIDIDSKKVSTLLLK